MRGKETFFGCFVALRRHFFEQLIKRTRGKWERRKSQLVRLFDRFSKELGEGTLLSCSQKE